MFWINAPVMEAHLYARQELSAPQTSETEEEELGQRGFVCAAVNTPGCRNGNWTRNVKKKTKKNQQGEEEGRMDSGGGG